VRLSGDSAATFASRASVVLTTMLALGSVPFNDLYGQISRAGSASAAATAPCITKAPRAEPMRYEEAVTRMRQDTLPDEGSHAVLGLRTLAIRGDGSRVIVDSRAKRVTIRDANWRVVTNIGREGSGPSEFRRPSFVVVGADARLWVLDMDEGRVSIFDRSGRFIRALSRYPANGRTLSLLNDSTVVVLGAAVTARGYVLATVLTESGRQLWQGVPADPLLSGTRLISDGVWGALRTDGQLVMGQGIAPTVQSIEPMTGRVRCTSQIPAEAWAQLDPAKRPATGRAATQLWLERASFIQHAVALPGAAMLVATERGSADKVQNEWTFFDANLQPVRRIHGVPGRLLTSRGDTLWMTSEADDGRAIVTQLRLSPHAVSGRR
jgi:hypothetical protein